MQDTKTLRITVLMLMVTAAISMNCDLRKSDPITSIRGRVTDSVTGEPVDSAIINLMDTTTVPVFSDSLGEYYALRMGLGLNLVFCRKEGYQSQSRVVSSSEDHATVTGVDFRLSPQ